MGCAGGHFGDAGDRLCFGERTAGLAESGKQIGEAFGQAVLAALLQRLRGDGTADGGDGGKQLWTLGGIKRHTRLEDNGPDRPAAGQERRNLGAAQINVEVDLLEEPTAVFGGFSDYECTLKGALR